MNVMTCAEFEILLCDAIDGTLSGSEREAFEAHQRTCAACAELAADAGGAVAFLHRTEYAEPPAELLTKIAFHIPSGGALQRGWKASLWAWFPPLLQPRVAMGMAMTILSFSMLQRFTGLEVRQLRPSDLHPAAVWSAIDNRAHRSWDQVVKYYENLRLVYEVQTRLQEWTEQEEEDRKGRPPAEDGKGTVSPSESPRLTESQPGERKEPK